MVNKVGLRLKNSSNHFYTNCNCLPVDFKISSYQQLKLLNSSFHHVEDYTRHPKNDHIKCIHFTFLVILTYIRKYVYSFFANLSIISSNVSVIYGVSGFRFLSSDTSKKLYLFLIFVFVLLECSHKYLTDLKS